MATTKRKGPKGLSSAALAMLQRQPVTGPGYGPQPGGQPGQVGRMGLSPEALQMMQRFAPVDVNAMPGANFVRGTPSPLAAYGQGPQLPSPPSRPPRSARLGLSPAALAMLGQMPVTGPGMGPQKRGQPGQLGRHGLSPEASAMLERAPSAGMGPPDPGPLPSLNFMRGTPSPLSAYGPGPELPSPPRETRSMPPFVGPPAPPPFVGPPAPSYSPMRTGAGMGPQQPPAMQSGPGMGPPASQGPDPATLSPSLQAMLRQGPVSPEMIGGMTRAREQGLLRERTQQPGPMPQAAPATPGAARVAPGMAPYNPSQAPAGGMDPNAKAIIDSFSGARVHKDMSGRQMGMGGVDPNLKYMLYAMRNRRHKSMSGQDIY